MEDPAFTDQHQMNPFGYSPADSGFVHFTSASPAPPCPSYAIQNVSHSNDVPCATERENPQDISIPNSNSQIISFHNSDPFPDICLQFPELQDFEEGMKTKSCGSRTPFHAQEHVIAERKRREKLSQHFTTLSASLPGLRKMDKASILGNTIKYLKQLEDRVKVLEEELAKRTVKSAFFVNRPSLRHGDGIVSSPSEENLCDKIIDLPLLQVEARASGKDVLIKIQCEKRRGCIEEVMKQVEDMKLTILNSNVLAFGSSLFDITIAAKIEYENFPTIEEIVKKLRHALTMFIGSSSRWLTC